MIIEPNPVICCLRQLVLRMIRQAGIENFLHFLVASQELGDHAAAPIVLLHPHRQRLHSSQNQPALERRQDRSGRLLQKRQLLGLLRLVQTTTPPRPSLWPLRNFVVEWTTMSAPSAIGCWKYGDMNVLSTTSSTFLRAAYLRSRPRISVNAISGLVGVSM